MQPSANMSIRAVVRLMATMIGLALAIALSHGVALADGNTLTGHVTGSTTALSSPSITTTTHAPTAQANINLAGSATQNIGGPNSGNLVSAPTNVSIPGNVSQVSGTGASHSATTSAPVSTVRLGNSNAPGSASVTAPTTARATTPPIANAQVNAGNTSLHNTTTVPVTTSGVTCPAVGVNVNGPRCGSPGSATGLVYAPTGAQAIANPSTSTQSHVGRSTVNNTTTLPTGATAGTCPLVGIHAQGYGCSTYGSGTGIAHAPTAAHATAALASSTNATQMANAVNNNTAAPLAAAATTCPVVGIHVQGYGCGSHGSGTIVGYAPTSAQGTTMSSTGTHATVVGNRISNSTTAPTNAHAATCPLVGIHASGYGCGQPGSATGVAFVPASGRAGAAPATGAHGNLAGNSLNNTASAPTGASLNTCPLVGVRIHGYGCGAPGSATGVVTAPSGGQATTVPVSQVNDGNTHVGGVSSTPFSVGITACPLAGMNVGGYGCGPDGSPIGLPGLGISNLAGSTGSASNLLGNAAVLGIAGSALRGGAPSGSTTAGAGNGPARWPVLGAQNANTASLIATEAQRKRRAPSVFLAPRISFVPQAVSAAPAAPATLFVPAVSAGSPSAQPAGPAPRAGVPPLTTPAGHPGAVPFGAAPLPRVPALDGRGHSPIGRGRGSADLHAAIPAAFVASAPVVNTMPASARGLSALPRTGGGMGSGGTPSVPFLPCVLALLLLALGTLTRKVTRAM